MAGEPAFLAAGQVGQGGHGQALRAGRERGGRHPRQPWRLEVGSSVRSAMEADLSGGFFAHADLATQEKRTRARGSGPCKRCSDTEGDWQTITGSGMTLAHCHATAIFSAFVRFSECALVSLVNYCTLFFRNQHYGYVVE